MGFTRSLSALKNTTAPMPSISATAALSASSGFFSSMMARTRTTASSSTSSRKITLPLRVDILPSGSETMPKGVCSMRPRYQGSSFSITANSCLKCRIWSAPTT